MLKGIFSFFPLLLSASPCYCTGNGFDDAVSKGFISLGPSDSSVDINQPVIVKEDEDAYYTKFFKNSYGYVYDNADEEKDGMSIKLQEIVDGKKRFVLPFKVKDNIVGYEMMPNSDDTWVLQCKKSKVGGWGFCMSISFKPEIAGHVYSRSSTSTVLSYIDPEYPSKLLPDKICKHGLSTKEPYNLKFRTPYYSSLVIQETEYSGACSGTSKTALAIRVTVKDLIKLEELKAEPYYDLKNSPDQVAHPHNFYGTPDTLAKIKQIAWEFYKQFNKKIKINDIGLVWGGRYDTSKEYYCNVDGRGHRFHRYGRQIDVNSLQMDEQQRECFKEIACRYNVQPYLEGKKTGSLLGLDFSNSPEEELDRADGIEHFHLNFALPTDMVVNPKDDPTIVCPQILRKESSCPKDIGE